MARRFVYGLSILIFMASGYITFLAVRGPAPMRTLNVYDPYQNNGKGWPDKEFAERVIKRKEQSTSSVNGLQRETSPLQKKVSDSKNVLEAQQQPQSVVDEKLARVEQEKETYQAQVAALQNRVSQLQEDLVRAQESLKEAERAQAKPQVAEELARVEQEKETYQSQVAALQNRVSQLQENLVRAQKSLKEAERAQAKPQVVEELARVTREKEALRTQVAKLDEHIKALQREPAQARQDKTAARTVASKPSTDGENRREIVITLTGLFASGQDTISQKSQDVIKQNAEQIKAMPKYRISVEGHTDNIPVRNTGFNTKYSDNMGLSYWRAMSVAIRLLELGVDSKRITVEGYGKTRPVASNETPEGRSKNRRVEIRLVRD